MKLTEDDRDLLARLGPEPTDVEGLAETLGEPAGDLEDRLEAFADNGLVDALGEGQYVRTQSGRRLLSTAGGRMDEAIDTTPAIEETLAGADLPADAVDAVRGAYAFLRYWGDATADEIVDAVYSEWPATFESPEEWWAGVGAALAALPEVAAPADDRDDVAATWHYTGQAEATEPHSDGFLPSERRGHTPYGSVRHAMAGLEDRSGAELTAVRAAFGLLRRRGTVTATELLDVVYPDHAAGYDSPDEWLDGLIAEAFETFPGVQRVDGEGGGTGEGEDDEEARWRYEPGPTQ